MGEIYKTETSRAKGGTPAGYPDFVPLNPWGRGFPKPPRPIKRDVFQVVVRDRRDGNKELRVGPRWEGREHAEMLCLAIAEQIALGAERRWVDPVVVPMS